MSKQNRPACPACGRKVLLSSKGVCYSCRDNPPKFKIGQRVEATRLVNFITNERERMGVFTVSKIKDAGSYGWEYSFSEKPSWSVSEKNLLAAEESAAQ